MGQTLLLACITGFICSVELRQATTLLIQASFFAEFSPTFWERTLGTKVIRTFIRPDLSLSNFLLLFCDRTVPRAFFLELLCAFTESTVNLGGPVRSQSCWGNGATDFRPDRRLLGLLIVICLFMSKEANDIKSCQLFRSTSFWLALRILTSMSEEQTFTSACTFVPILAHNFPTGVSANFSLQYRVAFSLEIE